MPVKITFEGSMNKVRTDMLDFLGLSEMGLNDLPKVEVPVLSTDGRSPTPENKVQQALKVKEDDKDEPLFDEDDEEKTDKKPAKQRRRTKAQRAADELREKTSTDDPRGTCQSILENINQAMGQAGLLRVRKILLDAMERQGGPVNADDPKPKLSNIGDTEIHAVLNEMTLLLEEAAGNGR